MKAIHSLMSSCTTNKWRLQTEIKIFFLISLYVQKALTHLFWYPCLAAKLLRYLHLPWVTNMWFSGNKRKPLVLLVETSPLHIAKGSEVLREDLAMISAEPPRFAGVPSHLHTREALGSSQEHRSNFYAVPQQKLNVAKPPPHTFSPTQYRPRQRSPPPGTSLAHAGTATACSP